MNNRKIEFFVGCFVLVGLIAILYLALQLGSARFFGKDSYTLDARFLNASGVNAGSRVEIAGVKVGTVKEVVLNDRFFAIVTFELPNRIQLDDDTIASIKTAGLIGDRYVQLSPGGSGFALEPDALIVDTESPLDIEDLISRFALGGIDESSK
jgi:phospholipid/cholesterol/gamma-HCH transport system substrate-binding protein